MRKVISRLGVAAAALALLAGCNTSPNNAAVVYGEPISADYLEEFAAQATALNTMETPAENLVPLAVQAAFVLHHAGEFDVPEAEVIKGIKSGQLLQGLPGALPEGQEPAQGLVDFFRSNQILAQMNTAGFGEALPEIFSTASSNGDITFNPKYTPRDQMGNLNLKWLLPLEPQLPLELGGQ
ncbi:MAG: hypothetical protein Q3999_00610 [Buchananella hordeovulneris]|nr:hypothetical protein [Buchananella hordeovulneris]